MIPALLLAGLCTMPPAQERDPAEAAQYVEVGDDARASGDAKVAAIAYRNALAHDPGNVHARTALAELCRSDRDAPDLQTAISLFRDGELDAAAAQFRALDGAAAHTFLGLIALQQHEPRVAERELEVGGTDPAYAGIAREMTRLARRDGVVAIDVTTTSEVDTNPALLPDTPVAGEMAHVTDEDVVVGGAVTARPLRWLVVRDVASYRVQRTQRQLDFITETVQVAGELARGRIHGGLAYDFDADALAGDAYLFAHHVVASARRDDDTLAVFASYGVRRRDYQQADQAGFTGWLHEADAGATYHASPSLDVDARLVGWREDALDPTFSNFAGGVQVGGRYRATSRVRVSGVATVWRANYDESEPDGSVRHDDHVEAGADVSFDLGDYISATAAVSAAWNGSTIDDFDYTRFSARLGLAFAIGVL